MGVGEKISRPQNIGYRDYFFNPEASVQDKKAQTNPSVADYRSRLPPHLPPPCRRPRSYPAMYFIEQTQAVRAPHFLSSHRSVTDIECVMT